MSLISRIDALPIRAKVLCGSFAYGYTEEEPKEPGGPRALRVGADVYRYSPPSWHLDVWEPRPHEDYIYDDVRGVWMEPLQTRGDSWWWCTTENINGVRGIWEHWVWTECEEEYTRTIEEVGDKVWRGGISRVDGGIGWLIYPPRAS